MAFQHSVANTISVSGRTISITNTYTGSQSLSINEEIADGATNAQVNAAIDVSATKSFLIVSDQDVTVETNSGSTPDDTIDLVANQPYTWNPDAYDDFLLGTDVTAFFITNASGETATVQIEALIDATP